MNWKKVKTVSGDFTVSLMNKEGEFLLHSKYDPVKEARRWLSQWDVENEAPYKICVIGIGAGYHIEEINKKYPDIPIIVLEFNPDYVKWLKENGYLKSLERENISIKVSDDMYTIKKILLKILDNPNFMVMLHAPSLELIPDSLTSLKGYLENYIEFLRTMRKNSSLLTENFRHNLNLEDKGILGWKNRLENKSIILISAGPSLTKQLPLLKKVNLTGGIFLACVGTALIPLLNYGIKPNAIMISDAQEKLLEQFHGTTNLQDVPLFYLATANHLAVSMFQGPRHIVWQKGYLKSEEQAQLRGEPQILTGGSVATCLLDLLIWMGGSRIALVGQDLSYTNGYSHAKGTHNIQRVDRENLREVMDYYQKGVVKTSPFLYSYLKWFEKYKRNIKNNVELWNCTEGGACIPGWTHKSLGKFVNMD